LSLAKNYFELFGLPVGFTVDSAELARKFRELQRQFHPDRYAAAPDLEKRLALQYATYINEANDCLKSPLSRAQYLMELAGFPRQESTMQNDTVFLLQQMEWREALDEAQTPAQRESLLQSTRLAADEYWREFEVAYQQGRYPQAQQYLNKMHFVTRFEKELLSPGFLQ
jgi:molecular chaperone HscB